MKNSLLILLQVILLCAPISNSFLYTSLQKRALTCLKEATEEQQYTTASEKFNARWNVMFERLKKYKEEHGDCLVPCKYKNDPKLGRWVSAQRHLSTLDDKTRQERSDKLNSIGFVWSARKQGRSLKYEKQWNEKFERLVRYKQEHRDCHPPFLWHQDPKLGQWISHQRALFANNKLPSDRRARLESIGFSWVVGPSLSESEKHWDSMFATLEKYYQHHGDCLVPLCYKEDPSLGLWVSTQRKNYSTLDSVRRDRLESIGFVWDYHDLRWEKMFAKLEKYRQQYGDCLVPQNYKEDPSLGMWVSTQRSNYANLSSTRRYRLESIGFVWVYHDLRWEKMFAKLEKYRQQHGDCNVPLCYKEDPSLGSWVSYQRKNHSTLDSVRRDRLESFGFVWDYHELRWEKMYAKLEKYRQQHGDCLVPIHYKEDPSLGRWASAANAPNLTLFARRDLIRLDSLGMLMPSMGGDVCRA